MLIHSVYFWLKDDLSDKNKENFKNALKGLLDIKLLEAGFIGLPAETRRPVIDSSYTYALILTFKDNEAQEAYQIDPIHKAFVENNKQYWTKVLVYDSTSL